MSGKNVGASLRADLRSGAEEPSHGVPGEKAHPGAQVSSPLPGVLARFRAPRTLSESYH